MKVLVTGADGFVGSWLVPRLRQEGHAVVAALRPTTATPGAGGLEPGVPTLPLELGDPDSIRAAVATAPDAVIHLAAVASGTDARRDPASAWQVNAVGTAALAEELGRGVSERRGNPLLLVASTAEVYGPGTNTPRVETDPTRPVSAYAASPRVETDPTRPVSAYAASKLAAEIAALEVHRRTGLRVIVARAFAHTGRGQNQRFVIPALARRLALAKRARAPAIKVGNLDPVREFMHVSDVVDAYCRLLSGGRPGEIYNVAGGGGIALSDLLDRLMEIVGHRVIPEADPELVRPADIPYLVGDAAKLRAATGWSPRVPLEDVLAEVVDAQAN
ncbi:MAG: GDP-mannose 4,6-dehydratase [Gemmatimonadetes bacterium]|nr:GDP-mannose 4,6-dehydratase [Gemmatimonadota bacterium]